MAVADRGVWVWLCGRMGLVSVPADRYASARTARGGERAQGSRMDERLIAQKAPFRVGIEAGTPCRWCAKRTAAAPTCDGSHEAL